MTVYKIKCLLNNKIYIGQTIKTLECRMYQHVYGSLKSKYKSALFESLRKYGKENFQISIISRCNSIEEMNHREQYYIQLFNTVSPNGYNLDSGGKNKKMHENTKKKLSDAHVGKKIIFTEEHKENISKALKKARIRPPTSSEILKKIGQALSGEKNGMWGKKRSKELTEKLIKINTGNKYWVGRKHSEESKKKISESRIGKYGGEKNPMYGRSGQLSPAYGKITSDITKSKISKSKNKYKKPVICIETNKIFNSLKDVARFFNTNSSFVSKRIRNNKKVKGFTFKFVDKEKI